jgi:hypothetical protein
MRSVYLIARKLDSPLTGNQYMLATAPNSGLGLSATPVSDHSYKTLDQLCEAIDECEAMTALDVAALRIALGDGEPHAVLITEESARCMGFKV